MSYKIFRKDARLLITNMVLGVASRVAERLKILRN